MVWLIFWDFILLFIVIQNVFPAICLANNYINEVCKLTKHFCAQYKYKNISRRNKGSLLLKSEMEC